MKHVELALLLPLSLSLVVSCEPRSDSGTNTNWLRQCVASADCDAADACLCGRCTRGCTSDEGCPSGTICAKDEAASLQCSGEPTATCQPSCTSSDDCESGRLCHHGACVDALPALTCSDGDLFCEDFEDPLSDEYISAITDGNGVERLKTSTPSGETALLSTVTEAPSTAYLRAELTPTSAGQLFLSGWVKVPDSVPHDVAPLALWSSTEESWALRLTLRDAGVEVWSETTPLTANHPLELGTWHCLQLGVTVADAPDGVVELFIDGASVETRAEVDSLPDGGIEAVAWGDLWAGTASDVVVDRVVVSTTPISCFD